MKDFKVGDRIRGDVDNEVNIRKYGEIIYISGEFASVKFDDGTSDGGIHLTGCVKMTQFKEGDRVKQLATCSGNEKGQESVLEIKNGELHAGKCTCQHEWELVTPVFKPGDKVRERETGKVDEVVGVPGVEVYDNNHYLSAGEGFTTKKNGWNYRKNWERIEPMSRYEELRKRIGEIGNGWDKKADELYEEIYNVSNLRLWVDCYGHDGSITVVKHGSMLYSIAQEKKQCNETYLTHFDFSSQCEKNKAFQDALYYLLDNSTIKPEPPVISIVGKEVKAEIEGKIYQVKVLSQG